MYVLGSYEHIFCYTIEMVCCKIQFIIQSVVHRLRFHIHILLNFEVLQLITYLHSDWLIEICQKRVLLFYISIDQLECRI